MERTVHERFARIREMATFVEEEADSRRWDSALARAASLDRDVAFVLDWLRAQADPRMAAVPRPAADTWDPPAAMALENVSGPMSGTLDADLPIPR
jgi:hypothetical protein